MSVTERALVFRCGDDELLGVVAVPSTAPRVGVVIVVGGPQYRVGSHRQFVRLSRRLAEAGHAVLRFDYRGMGDSTGGARSFEVVTEDIAAAGTALMAAQPSIVALVLFGLCDGASATLLSLDGVSSLPVAGLCLVNPWVRSEASLARTTVRHYYLRRLAEASFWRKLLAGGVAAKALRDLLQNARHAVRRKMPPRSSYQRRMAEALRVFAGPVLIVLSEDDLTAREFGDYAGRDPSWQGILRRPNIATALLRNADHTFSGNDSAHRLEQELLGWLGRFGPRPVPANVDAKEIFDGHG